VHTFVLERSIYPQHHDALGIEEEILKIEIRQGVPVHNFKRDRKERTGMEWI
jgi:hypothetical protein